MTALVAGACNTVSTEKKEEHSSEAFKDDFELNELTIDALQQKMQNKEYTSRSITELYFKRIEALDKAGPKLNAVIQVNPDALQIAEAMDKERSSGKVRGPLHGIPVLIKDNIDTGDKMMTTAGALALERKHRQTGCLYYQKTAGGGCCAFRQNQFERMGQFPLHAFYQRLEQPGRTNQMSLYFGS